MFWALWLPGSGGSEKKTGAKFGRLGGLAAAGGGVARARARERAAAPGAGWPMIDRAHYALYYRTVLVNITLR